MNRRMLRMSFFPALLALVGTGPIACQLSNSTLQDTESPGSGGRVLVYAKQDERLTVRRCPINRLAPRDNQKAWVQEHCPLDFMAPWSQFQSYASDSGLAISNIIDGQSWETLSIKDSGRAQILEQFILGKGQEEGWELGLSRERKRLRIEDGSQILCVTKQGDRLGFVTGKGRSRHMHVVTHDGESFVNPLQSPEFSAADGATSCLLPWGHTIMVAGFPGKLGYYDFDRGDLVMKSNRAWESNNHSASWEIVQNSSAGKVEVRGGTDNYYRLDFDTMRLIDDRRYLPPSVRSTVSILTSAEPGALKYYNERWEGRYVTTWATFHGLFHAGIHESIDGITLGESAESNFYSVHPDEHRYYVVRTQVEGTRLLLRFKKPNGGLHNPVLADRVLATSVEQQVRPGDFIDLTDRARFSLGFESELGSRTNIYEWTHGSEKPVLRAVIRSQSKRVFLLGNDVVVWDRAANTIERTRIDSDEISPN